MPLPIVRPTMRTLELIDVATNDVKGNHEGGRGLQAAAVWEEMAEPPIAKHAAARGPDIKTRQQAGGCGAQETRAAAHQTVGRDVGYHIFCQEVSTGRSAPSRLSIPKILWRSARTAASQT